MIYFYSGCVIVSIIMYLLLYITDVKRSLCQHVMVIIMTFSNLGYLSLALSGGISGAIVSAKIVNLGGSFLPVLYFFTMCEVCHVNVRRRVKLPLVMFQLFVYLCVCTMGFNDLYYKDIQFVNTNGYGQIVKSYGPLHFLYPLTMYGYLILTIFVAFWAIKNKKGVNHREIVNMIFFSVIATMVYLVQRIVKFDVDIMSISFIILMIGTIQSIYHSNLYTAYENNEIIKQQLTKIGFLTFNEKMKYMGANDYAISIFPELRDCKIGKTIDNPGEKLQEIISYIETYRRRIIDMDEASYSHIRYKTIEKDEKYYDAQLHDLCDFRKKCVGYTVEIKDETEHYRMLELTGKFNEELSDEVKEKTKQIRSIQEKTILGMAQMVESRDLSTGGHIKRTSDVVRIFSKKLLESDMGFDEHFLELVIRSAPMHDLGKIGVDDAILRKQGKFTEEEYDKMKKHAEIGGKMVSEILTGVEENEFVQIAYNVAKYHHEKVSGNGYPVGLKGEEIPLEARIMALADVFDALVSKRCYKESFSYDKAFSIIEEDAGVHFDYDLAMVFISCRSELEAYYNKNS